MSKRYKLIYVPEVERFGLFDTVNNCHHAIHSGTPMKSEELNWNINDIGGEAERYSKLEPESTSDNMDDLLGEYQILKLIDFKKEAF